MLVRLRYFLVVSLCVAVLSACADHRASSASVEVRVAPVQQQPVPPDLTPFYRQVRFNLDVERWNLGRWNLAVLANAIEAGRARDRAAAVKYQVRARRVMAPSFRPVAAVAAPGSVKACIYAHESGNYTEHSHPGSGSGAAQWVPTTWRAWSARAGHPGYSLAYLAPGWVQEAVLDYTLTHGGAGNWSNRFGNDPCTQGMGG